MRARRSTGAMAAWGVLACAALSAPGAAMADGDGCPNASIRALQGAEQVADCRAFELVSPVDKGRTDVAPLSAQSALQPGVAVFGAPGAMPGSVASLSSGVFRAERTANGWTTRSPDLPQANMNEQVIQSTRFVSRDLSKALVLSRHAFAAGAVEGDGNAYEWDAASGALRLIATSSAPKTRGLFRDLTSPNELRILATPGMDRVVFTTNDALVPGAPVNQANMYEWHDGDLRLVNVLPDGSPTGGNAGVGAISNGFDDRHAISDDGSRIVFRFDGGTSGGGGSVGSGGLYVRIDGSTTKLISHYQRSGEDPAQPVAAQFAGASADGSTVFFKSSEALTEDAGVVDSHRNRLYRYDAATDTISLAVPSTAADFGVSLGVSDDGSRVYFTTNGALDSPINDSQTRLYVWDRGAIKLVAEPVVDTLHPILNFSISPDGRFASFMSTDPLLGHDNTSPECHESRYGNLGLPEGTCREAYAYDAQTEELLCLSCPREGRSAGHAGTGFTGGLLGQKRARAVTSDGTFFFDTPNALVPGDVNRRRDVYEWKAGEAAPRLVTTGTGAADAQFSDVSVDGTDVYLTTLDPLVRADRDDLRDLYTARRDGGFAAQNAAVAPVSECVGEACRAPQSAPPPGAGLGSSLVRGAGDVPVAKPVAVARVGVSVRARVAGVRTTMRVRVSGAGTVNVAGASVRGVRRSVAKPATYTLGVSLSARAKRLLQHRRSVRTRVKVTFRPRSGRTVSRSVVVTFEQTKGGR